MRLTRQQWKVLRLFLEPNAEARTRAVWLDGEGRSLGQVERPYSPRADAHSVRVYRLADSDAETFCGDAMGRTVLNVGELADLAACWAEPLRTLSDLGRQLALEPEPRADPALIVTFKAAPELDRWISTRADAEGRSRTALILQALSEYRERHR